MKDILEELQEQAQGIREGVREIIDQLHGQDLAIQQLEELLCRADERNSDLERIQDEVDKLLNQAKIKLDQIRKGE